MKMKVKNVDGDRDEGKDQGQEKDIDDIHEVDNDDEDDEDCDA